MMIRRLPDRLETGRLILRASRKTDAPVLFDRYMQDAEVTRYLTWRPAAALTQTEDFIAQCIRDWTNGSR